MLSEGLEKDFTNWELRVAQECEIVKALLGEEISEANEEIFLKLDELAKLFGTDAPKFVELLKEINKTVFIEKITKRERIDSDNLNSVVEFLKDQRRIPTKYIENLNSLMNIDAQNFGDIKLPAKNEIFLFKAMPRGEDKEAKRAQLDTLHEKFEKLIFCLISFSNIVAWYHRTYEETPYVGFTWDYDGDGGEKKRKESGETPVVQDFKGVLDSQYDIMRAPVRMFNKTVLVEECKDFERVVERTYQIPQAIEVEKMVYEGQPFIQPHEIVTEKLMQDTFQTVQPLTVERFFEVPGHSYIPEMKDDLDIDDVEMIELGESEDSAEVTDIAADTTDKDESWETSESEESWEAAESGETSESEEVDQLDYVPSNVQLDVQTDVVQITQSVEVEKVIEKQVVKPVETQVEVVKEVIKRRSPVLVIFLIFIFTLAGVVGGYFLQPHLEPFVKPILEGKTIDVASSNDSADNINEADVKTDSADQGNPTE